MIVDKMKSLDYKNPLNNSLPWKMGMFNFLAKYAVCMFFLAFVICMNIRFFSSVQLDPLSHILCVQKENERLPGRNDVLWPGSNVELFMRRIKFLFGSTQMSLIRRWFRRRIKVSQCSLQHFPRRRFLMGHNYYSLSIDNTIMVSKYCPITSEHVDIIFVTQ